MVSAVWSAAHKQSSLAGWSHRLDGANTTPKVQGHRRRSSGCRGHKHAKVRAWLAKRPRFHVHFTPTYSSWINQVERWFGLISQRAIKRGSFTSVTDLVRCIHAFTREYNQHANPFVWVATAQSIIDKIERLSTRISDSPH